MYLVEARPYFNESMVQLTKLIRLLGNQPKVVDELDELDYDDILGPTILKAQSALDTCHSIVKNRHQESNNSCQSLEFQISRLEEKRRDNKALVRSLFIQQSGLKSQIEDKRKEIRRCETQLEETKAERERAELTTGEKVGLLALALVPLAGFVSLKILHDIEENQKRLNNMIDSHRGYINSYTRELQNRQEEMRQVKQNIRNSRSQSNRLAEQLREKDEEKREAAQLSTLLASVRQAVCQINDPVDRMKGHNVSESVRNLMQILRNNNEVLVASLSTPKAIQQLQYEWQWNMEWNVFERSLQYCNNEFNCIFPYLGCLGAGILLYFLGPFLFIIVKFIFGLIFVPFQLLGIILSFILDYFILASFQLLGIILSFILNHLIIAPLSYLFSCLWLILKLLCVPVVTCGSAIFRLFALVW